MILAPLARAYTLLLKSIPKEPFPIEDSPKILSSIEERIDSLKKAIQFLPEIPQTMVGPAITLVEESYPVDSPFFPLLSQYLRAEAPLPKETILTNLEDATPFLTSSLKITPAFYVENLGLEDPLASKHLPSKTVEFFHAHACGQRMESHEFLGAGTFGAVFRKTLSGISFASKGRKVPELPSTASDVNQITSKKIEACAYSLFKHPNILELLSFTDSPCELYLKYANNLTLDHLIKAQVKLKYDFRVLPSRLRCRFSIHIASALDYLHESGFTHCDVKPANILVDNDNFKLGDFGFIAYTKNNTRTALTPDYAAPETIKKEHLSEKSDVWAYAITLYKTFKNHIPYTMQRSDNDNWQAYKDRLYKELYGKPAQSTKIFREDEGADWHKYDPGYIFRELIEKCLDGVPRSRLSMKEICKYLYAHPFVTKALTEEKQEASAAL